ncbi:MAG: hypothetical protein J5803_05360 [Desulfovibrio sp.]|nr:hypothetical protein [Desulfovibrio sp.]
MHRLLLFFRTQELLFLCLFVCLMQGCAGRSTIHPESTASKALWERYLTNDSDIRPYRINMSLRIGKSGDTRRVTALLWGNDMQRQRLDVMAGVGSIVAKIASSPNDFLLVAPIEGKAYSHSGSQKPRLHLSLPLPLTLSDLTCLLTGQYTKVFGKEYGELLDGSKNNVRYTLLDALPGTLELDDEGRPSVWDERTKRDKNGWTMRLQYGKDGFPSKLDLSNTKGERFLLVIKEKEAPQSFSEEALSLSVPQGFPILPITQKKSTL